MAKEHNFQVALRRNNKLVKKLMQSHDEHLADLQSLIERDQRRRDLAREDTAALYESVKEALRNLLPSLAPALMHLTPSSAQAVSPAEVFNGAFVRESPFSPPFVNRPHLDSQASVNHVQVSSEALRMILEENKQLRDALEKANGAATVSPIRPNAPKS